MCGRLRGARLGQPSQAISVWRHVMISRSLNVARRPMGTWPSGVMCSESIAAVGAEQRGINPATTLRPARLRATGRLSRRARRVMAQLLVWMQLSIMPCRQVAGHRWQDSLRLRLCQHSLLAAAPASLAMQTAIRRSACRPLRARCRLPNRRHRRNSRAWTLSLTASCFPARQGGRGSQGASARRRQVQRRHHRPSAGAATAVAPPWSTSLAASLGAREAP